MSESEILQELRAYIAENFLYARPGHVVGDDEHLLETGVIDSMGMLELLAHLKERYGVEPPDDQITEDNFGTLSRIAGYVTRNTTAAPGAGRSETVVPSTAGHSR